MVRSPMLPHARLKHQPSCNVKFLINQLMRIFVQALSFIFVYSSTSDIAMLNTTATGGWTGEPDERGTIDLVWSCVVTVLLCTWNALHPNLPGEEEKEGKVS